jgi:hypothetical protein
MIRAGVEMICVGPGIVESQAESMTYTDLAK